MEQNTIMEENYVRILASKYGFNVNDALEHLRYQLAVECTTEDCINIRISSDIDRCRECYDMEQNFINTMRIGKYICVIVLIAILATISIVFRLT